MRGRRELLELLRKECKKQLAENAEDWICSDKPFGICDVAYELMIICKITTTEMVILNEILESNWYLAKYPDGAYKFDTKAERLEFLDKLIEKYANEEKTNPSSL